jgi:hypothetical protein
MNQDMLVNKNKKEHLQLELELEKLGIDIDKVDHDLLNLIYDFIGDVYSNIKFSDQIINRDVLNNYTNKLIEEGSQDVDKKDT